MSDPDNCISWNCCDDNLKECIERSKYVKQIRNLLKKKKFKKEFKK